ncbi:MAG: DUF4350 domain-containing protein [Ginsengibacter sp.]
MKKFFRYLSTLIVLTFLQQGCIRQENVRLPSLNETFKKEDKNPFGGYIAYTHFKKLFGYRYVQINEKPFDEAWQEMEKDIVKYSLYVLITKNLAINTGEAEALLEFVRKGNDLFISADYIDDELLNKIHCQEERRSEIVSEVAGMMKVTSVSMHGNYGDSHGGYKYFYYPFLNSFNDYDSAYTRVLGINEMDSANYVMLFLGKGRLYLHAAPRALSNYFLLTQSNYQYLQNILSYLRPEPENIYWDEYYKNKRITKKNGRGDYVKNETDNNFSSLGVIKKHSSLLWAFWLSVVVIVTYILSNIKRKQRIINEIKPNENTTLVFTETVGRLYLQKKDNKNISEKMITYFYEYIRNKFFMNTSRINDQFVTSLAGKAGITVADTEKIFDTISHVQSIEVVTDVELLSLNQQIQNFYKNRN